MSAGPARADGLLYAKLVAMSVCWGGQWVAGRYIAAHLPHFVSGAVRFLIASVFLCALLLAREGRFPRLAARDWIAVIGLGATGIFLFNAMFFAGLVTVPASRGALVSGLNGVFAAIGAWLVFGERMTLVRWAGAMVAVLGVALVVSHGDLPSLLSEGIGRGEVMLLIAVASWAAYTLIGRTAMGRMSPLAATTLGAIAGTVFLAIAAWVDGGVPDFEGLPAAGWFALFYLGFFGTVVAFFWYLEGVQRIGPSRAAAFINLVPVFGVIAGGIVLGEPLTWSTVVGGALVLAGVALVNRVPAPRA